MKDKYLVITVPSPLCTKILHSASGDWPWSQKGEMLSEEEDVKNRPKEDANKERMVIHFTPHKVIASSPNI